MNRTARIVIAVGTILVLAAVAAVLIFVFHVGNVGVKPEALESIDVTPSMEISSGDPEKNTVDLGQEFGQFVDGASGLTQGVKSLEPFVQSDICGTLTLYLAGWRVEEISSLYMTLVRPDGNLEEIKLVLGPETTFRYLNSGPPVEISLEDLHVGDKVNVYIRWQKMYEDMKPVSWVDKCGPLWLRENKPIEWMYMGGGKVEKISGRILTIRENPYYQGNGQAVSDIFVAENVVVRIISVDKEESRTEVSFESVKVGDTVSVSGYFTDVEGLVINEITLR
jgi:hypothetical protein